MKLQDLFAGIDVDASLSKHARLEVTHVASDSRTVEPGSLFVALAGKQSDGAQFVNEAVDRGAVAVISEKPIGGAKAPVFQVRSARRALAKVAANFYGNPAKDLVLLGVTGTNGKTTVAWLVESICAAGMNPVGLFGTIAVRYGGRSYPVTHTTPDPLTLHRTLRAMVDDGIDTVVLEVSSHAMLQERLHGLHFRAAGFTNLSRDHLDYHPDLESYFQAKRKLFTENVLPGGLAVVHGDDTYTMRVYNEVRQQRCQAWRFSRFGNAELSAEKVESDARGIRGVLKTPAGDITFDSSLVGAHNLDNILCAAGIALAGGASRRDVQEGIGQVRSIRGRMEPVVGKGITAYVDYAHTDDALTKALEAARALTKGKLFVVFGCGGERDTGKRPLMGEAAAAADVAVVTSDNPRGENPAQIAAHITTGLEKAGLRRVSPAKIRSGERGYVMELDRSAAIRLAVSLMVPGDTLVVAGKGHETEQEIAGERHPFDDHDEVRKYLA